ncbi:biotin--[acetyl-CoA-carboxylase] ligase [Salinisphaera orenii]|uniref:biotin--[acetyl-CoA-carboxylase] ligase n=1 Tax=Salinisphaera orenii TaxID=856731 RepID=UPI001C852741|nr:biotin--[acetyl-CoA-carboxylase] ligase [Salinisphaera orenii]
MTEAPTLAGLLADGGWHRGPALAEALGVSRAAVSARVADLRARGLDVFSVAGRGYRLAAPLELLDSAAIRAALPADVGVLVDTIDVRERLDSTNAELARTPVTGTAALLAEYQSAGRGRGARGWVSPFGANLYLSVSAPLGAPRAPIGALSLAVGVALADALTAFGARDIGLKWPNDLWAGGRKLGGILIEHRGEIGGGARVIVGIGLNLTMQTVDIDQPWTRLADHMDRLGSRNAVAGVVLGGVLRALDGFQSQGFEPFQARWPVFDVARDAPVRVIEGDGEQVGIARGIGPDGALQVEIGGRTRPVYSGDVSLRLGA